MSASPTWYDVLGVDADASAEEVRAAWRAGIADLDPSDRRFRSLNQAAEVLLDPQARAAYDASLAEPAPTSAEPVPTPEPSAGRAARSASDERASRPTRRSFLRGRAVRSGSDERASRPAEKTDSRSRLPLVPAWALVVALVLALASATTATVAAVQAGEPVVDLGGGGQVEESAEQARTAAERAIVPVLSYDYRQLEEDAAAARSYMTSRYQEEKYDPLFSGVVQENAERTETVVTTEVVESAVVRTGEDRVDVLLFVDRATLNKSLQEPVVYKDQATVTMAKVDGQWLVDELNTSSR